MLRADIYISSPFALWRLYVSQDSVLLPDVNGS